MNVERSNWRRVAPLAALLLMALALAQAYFDRLPAVASHVGIVGWQGVPLGFAALVSVTWLLACGRSSKILLPAAGLLWLVGVACAAWIVPGEPAFFWRALAPYFLAALVFVAAGVVRPTPLELRTVITAAALVAAAAVLLDAEGLLPDHFAALTRRPRGLFLNRNAAGEYLALGAPFALVALSRPRLRWLLLLLGIALVWTRCRTAWLAVGLSALVVLVLAEPTRRRALAGSLALLLAGTLAAGIVPSRLRWSEPLPYRATAARLLEVGAGSGALRIRQHVLTLALVRAHPLRGLGPGHWQTELRRREPTLAINRVPHSDFLRALADGGFPAAIGLILLYAAALRTAWRVRRKQPELFAAVMALVAESAADAVLFRVESLGLAFVVLGTLARRRAVASRLHIAAATHEGGEHAYTEPAAAGVASASRLQ